MLVNGILHLYHHFLSKNAPTILEHVYSFEKYSQFKVWSVNTEMGFPKYLNDMQFEIIVLHYSIFATNYYRLNNHFINYLEKSQSSYKIAFFQDEYHYCKKRFDFINYFNIDCIYTLLEPCFFNDVYKKYTKVREIYYVLPGYVSIDLVNLASRITKKFRNRSVDVGYRGRPLPFYMGEGAQEKVRIGEEFKKRARHLNLKLDIESDEKKRIYGGKWYRFLANCKSVLGVEAGVSIFDVEDKVRLSYEQMIKDNPQISFSELQKKLLNKWENNIYYRTISPRHFETSALRVCQVLFEGKYSGVLKPYIHYIPLKKDFTNFDEVIKLLKDTKFCKEITENAYNDLIASGEYSYQEFVHVFDEKLSERGFNPALSKKIVVEVNAKVKKFRLWRLLIAESKFIIFDFNFPLRGLIISLIRPVLKPILWPVITLLRNKYSNQNFEKKRIKLKI